MWPVREKQKRWHSETVGKHDSVFSWTKKLDVRLFMSIIKPETHTEPRKDVTVAWRHVPRHPEASFIPAHAQMCAEVRNLNKPWIHAAIVHMRRYLMTPRRGLFLIEPIFFERWSVELSSFRLLRCPDNWTYCISASRKHSKPHRNVSYYVPSQNEWVWMLTPLV